MGLFDTVAKVVGIGSTALGTLFGAQGASKEAGAQAASLNAQRTLALKNRRIALATRRKVLQRGRQLRKDVQARGLEQEQQVGLQARQLEGRQRTILAANGVVVDRDVARDIVTDTRRIAAADIETVRANTAREARSVMADARLRAFELKQQAGFYKTEAGLQGQAAASVASAGRTKVFSTILGGLGSVADKWYSFTRG